MYVMMDRQSSISSDGTTSRYPTSSRAPPWEIPPLPQVPYMDPGSTPLSQAERQALPSLWATRSSTASSVRPRLNTNTSTPSGTSSFSPISLNEKESLWSATQPAPYETPVYIPPAPRTSPPVLGRAVSTPPDSVSRSSTSTKTSSPPVKALPGTMSSRTSRDRTPSRRRHRSSSRDQRIKAHRSKTDPIPFGRRMRSAFKDMFKKDPVDESMFERIEDRHWADEDY